MLAQLAAHRAHECRRRRPSPRQSLRQLCEPPASSRLAPPAQLPQCNNQPGGSVQAACWPHTSSRACCSPQHHSTTAACSIRPTTHPHSTSPARSASCWLRGGLCGISSLQPIAAVQARAGGARQTRRTCWSPTFVMTAPQQLLARQAALLGASQCLLLQASSCRALEAASSLCGFSSGWAQQARGYAKAAKGGGKAAAAKAAAASAAPAAAADPYAPPEFRLRRVPWGYKGDGLGRLSEQQKQLLQQLTTGGAAAAGAPLRSLRQLGWPLGQHQVLGLLHDQLSDAAGSAVAVTPFVLGSFFQSAAALAGVVRDYLAIEGKGMPAVEQALLTTIANMPPGQVSFEGIKVQLKGRMGGKGGKASKRVWVWGRTSASDLRDPVDYAHEAVVTRAGYIGIKVWIRYKRSHMAAQAPRSTRSAFSVQQVLAMPPLSGLPSRSSSAWWNTPGPLQPQQHRAWECFAPGYDALTSTWKGQPLLPVPEAAAAAPAAAAAADADGPRSSS